MNGIEGICGLQQPTNLTEIWSSMSLSSEFRLIVSNFARIAPPLYCQLKKDRAFEFGRLKETKLEAHVALQRSLMSSQKRALPKRGGRNRLDTDRCDKQVQFVLLQEQLEGPAKPEGYRSLSLEKTEKAFKTMYREGLVVIWPVLQLRPYLDGPWFTVRTANDAI